MDEAPSSDNQEEQNSMESKSGQRGWRGAIWGYMNVFPEEEAKGLGICWLEFFSSTLPCGFFACLMFPHRNLHSIASCYKNLNVCLIFSKNIHVLHDQFFSGSDWSAAWDNVPSSYPYCRKMNCDVLCSTCSLLNELHAKIFLPRLINGKPYSMKRCCIIKQGDFIINQPQRV
jgi:hypothetical protein